MEWERVEYGMIRREDDGIFHLRLDPDTRIEGPAARAMVKALEQHLEGRGLLLADITNLAWIDRAARDIIAQGRYAKARALLVRSATAQVLAQLFQALHNPAIPTRTFASEKEARDWLRSIQS